MQEPLLYEFKLAPNTMKATKNICCVQSEGGHPRVTRLFKKFCSGCSQGDTKLKILKGLFQANRGNSNK